MSGSGYLSASELPPRPDSNTRGDGTPATEKASCGFLSYQDMPRGMEDDSIVTALVIFNKMTATLEHRLMCRGSAVPVTL